MSEGISKYTFPGRRCKQVRQRLTIGLAHDQIMEVVSYSAHGISATLTEKSDPWMIFASAQEVFRNVFDDPAIVLRDDMTADDIPGWDSLTHINLMVATEKRFKIKFATAEISKMKEDGQNVGTFLALIGKKLGRTS